MPFDPKFEGRVLQKGGFFMTKNKIYNKLVDFQPCEE